MLDKVQQEAAMEVEGVERLIFRLVRAPEADEVGRHDARAACDEPRNHPPVEIAPGRLAVQAEKRALALTFVDVMDAPVAPREERHVRIVECLDGLFRLSGAQGD